LQQNAIFIIHVFLRRAFYEIVSGRFPKTRPRYILIAGSHQFLDLIDYFDVGKRFGDIGVRPQKQAFGNIYIGSLGGQKNNLYIT
jgi:hypothetical protein